MNLKHLSNIYLIPSIILHLLICGKSENACAQSYSYEVQTIPLKGDFINFFGSSILQDSDGFMWFGSREGLYRYQGTSVKIYRHIQDDENSLLDNFVSDMYEDSEGVMWLCTLNGLNRFDKYTETFTSFKYIRDDTTSIIGGRINKITEDKYHRLWIATDGGFSSYDRETGIFKNYKVERQDSSIIKNPYEIYYLYPDDEEFLWLATENGVYRFHIPSGNFEKIKDIENDITSEVYKDRSGRYWFISLRGLYLYDLISQTYIRFTIESEYLNMPESQVARTMIEDEMGNIWIRTYGGIYCYDQELKLMYSLEHPYLYPENVRNHDLLKELFIDQTGSIWFYTQEAINQIIPKGSNFRVYDSDFLAGTEITCIYPENKDLIWFGTPQGINILDREKNEYRMQFGDSVWRIDNPDTDWRMDNPNAVRFMYPDRNGTLWIGMHTRGLFSMIISENGERRLQKYQLEGINSGNLRESGLYGLKYIFEDSGERLWVSGVGLNGQLYYDRLENRLIHLTDNPSAKDKLPVKGVIRHQTGSDTLWSIGSSGIYKIILPLIKISDDSVMPANVIKCRLYDETGQETGIPQVNRTYMDSTGNIWLGTRISGLIKASRKLMLGTGACEYTLKIFSTDEGLPSENIMSILPDEDSNLWMGTYNGLSKLNTRTETFTNYFIRHGLPTNIFHEGSAATGVDRELFFGTIAGMISFYPDSIFINEHIAPVMITGIRINNQPLQPGENNKVDTSISYVDNIELKYNQDNISFEYAILNYNNPEWNQYRYKLEGFNDDWVYAGNRTYVDFTNLKPGKYAFHVTGSNNDGVWNEEGRSLGIIIHRPPWSSWYAWLTYIIILGGIIVWYRRLLQKRARLRLAVEVERVEKEKVLELDQMKSRFFANISHEFRTPLTLISGPLEDLGKQEAETISLKRNVLDMMKRNSSKLRNLINQLLDLSKMETGNIKLQVAERTLEPFLRSMVLSFLSLAESKKIRYLYNLPESGLSLWFDADKLEKILVNLISNAFKFTPEQGEVRIKGKYSNREGTDVPEYLVLTVTDTGIGIPAGKLDHIFDRFYQVNDTTAREAEGTGIGLAMVKELLEVYRGEINVHSQAGEGTTFTTRIPVSGDLFREDEKVLVDHDHTGPVVEETYMEVNGNLGNIPDQSGNEEKPQILIVEDNPDLSDYIAGMLDRDYRLARAGNGKQGFNLTVEIIPELVISDLMMPVMDGLEMCRLIKEDERTNHIPVIILTARADRGSKLEGLQTGADDYIIKPFDGEELKVRVANLIEQRNKLREKFRKEFMSPDSLELPSAPDDPFMGKLLKLIESRHSDFEFSVDEMFDKMHMGRTQFFLKVHALTGESPNELLRLFRIKQAASMLRSGTDNITTIMYEVGFRSTSHFANSFKKFFGVNPSEYREGAQQL